MILSPGSLNEITEYFTLIKKLLFWFEEKKKKTKTKKQKNKKKEKENTFIQPQHQTNWILRSWCLDVLYIDLL